MKYTAILKISHNFAQVSENSTDIYNSDCIFHQFCFPVKRYGNKYIVSSEFKWLAHMISSSRLWTNKVDLSEGDQNDYTLSCMRPLFNFYNRGGNAVRHMLVAECPKQLVPDLKTKSSCQDISRGIIYLSLFIRIHLS